MSDRPPGTPADKDLEQRVERLERVIAVLAECQDGEYVGLVLAAMRKEARLGGS